MQRTQASKETVFFFKEKGRTSMDNHKGIHVNTGSACGTQKGVSFHVV